ncbi:MAG: ABC transporter ATP-binding protein [Motiliproteus sp.]|nr:ABC transporter ATP-binding protein [Motiliproteus sp.]MCW9054267.1 ABC transporter ATP-binding protein [Motiliproteus sp.]
MSLLQAENLSVAIGGRVLCREVNLSLGATQIWGLLGGNGVGKTTLLHTLAGLRIADAGELHLGGKPIGQVHSKQRAQQMGVLLQEDQSSFPATVMESVLMGRHPHLASWQWETAQDRQIAEQALQQVELAELADRQIDELSGGERQRLKLATLLVQSPSIWLLDEPTNHLDLNHRIQLITALVTQVKEQAGTLLMSLHDLQLAHRFCDRLVCIFTDGSTRQGSVEELMQPEILSELYQYPIQRLETEAGPVFLPR